MLLAAALLVVLGICAGAAVPPANADDDDNGGNGGADVNFCSDQTPGAQTGTDPATGAVTQTCVIDEPTGTCIQKSSAPKVMQRCEFEQASGTSNIRMTALQVHNPEGGPSGEQDAIQVIAGTQTNTSTIPRRNGNYLSATQIADQCLGHGDPFEDDDGDWNDDDDDGDRDDDGRCEDGDEEDGDDEEDGEDDERRRLLLLTSFSLPTSISQDQEAHQTIDALQTTAGAGKNEAYAEQTQHLHERAANATTIEQFQNTDTARANECGAFSGLADPAFGNACFSVKQASGSGAKIVELDQEYRLFQSARNAMDSDQEQGVFAPGEGGLVHNFDQATGSGTARQDSDQIERLTQRRRNVDFFSYHQNAAPRKDVGLQSGVNSRANMLQDASAMSNGGDIGFGSQDVFMLIECTSTGNCRGEQHAATNNDSHSQTQSAPMITMAFTCFFFEGEGEGGQCPAVGG
jgi:hypothetical protein